MDQLVLGITRGASTTPGAGEVKMEQFGGAKGEM